MYGMFGRTFEEDPFFEMHRQRMGDMERLMGRHPFFGAGMAQPHPALTDGHLGGRAADRAVAQQRDVRDPFSTMFDHMNSMMRGMHGVMGDMHRNMGTIRSDPNSHYYTQSAVYSYSNTGEGQPRVYQASHSTAQAPGGVREERRAVRDSQTGIEKMSVGHHIGERGHVITKSRNQRTGDREENTDYIGLDESEAADFDRDWRQRTQRYHGDYERAVGGRRPAGGEARVRRARAAVEPARPDLRVEGRGARQRANDRD